MTINKESINKIINLRKKIKHSQKNIRWNITDKAFMCLTYLYPLGGKYQRIDEKIDGNNVYIGREIKVSYYRHGRRKKSLDADEWLCHYCNEDNFEKIKELSTHIKNDEKRYIFLQIHNILSKLNMKRSPFGDIQVEKDVDISTFDFEEEQYSYRSDSNYGKIKDVEIKKILFDGYNFKIDENNFKISVDNIALLNIIDEHYDTFNNLIDMWYECVNKLIKIDTETLYKARELTAKYEIISKL